MAMLKLAEQTALGSNPLKLLQQARLEHRFRVDYMAVLIEVAVSNSDAVNDQILEAENFLTKLKLDWKWADGQKWLENMPFAAIGLMAHLIDQGTLPDPQEFAKSPGVSGGAGPSAFAGRNKYSNAVTGGLFNDFDRAHRTTIRSRVIQKSASEQSEQFLLFIPLRDNSARRPLDFCQAISQFGELNITMPESNLGGAGLSIDGYTVRLLAIGEYANELYVGTRKQYRVESLLTPQATQSINLRGKLVRALAYTTDHTTAPLAQEGPTIRIDEQKPIVHLPATPMSFLGGLSQWLGSSVSWDLDALAIYETFCPWIQPTVEYSSLGIARGATLNLEFESNAGASGKQYIAIEEIVARKPGCLRKLPGMANATPEQARIALEVLKADPGIVNDADRDWLPGVIKLASDELETCS